MLSKTRKNIFHFVKQKKLLKPELKILLPAPGPICLMGFMWGIFSCTTTLGYVSYCQKSSVADLPLCSFLTSRVRYLPSTQPVFSLWHYRPTPGTVTRILNTEWRAMRTQNWGLSSNYLILIKSSKEGYLIVNYFKNPACLNSSFYQGQETSKTKHSQSMTIQ